MAGKSDFSADEWQTLLESVMFAGVAVTAADPSGLWGSIKEGFANASALAEAKVEGHPNELIRAIAADFATGDGRKIVRDGLRDKLKGSDPDGMRIKAVAGLRRVRSVLDLKTSDEDSAAVRTWLHGISQRVAEAAKEGGFLGFGGERVSAAEQATLDQIADVLDVGTAT